MKRKIVSVILAAAMLGGALAGCGNSSAGSGDAGESGDNGSSGGGEDKEDITITMLIAASDGSADGVKAVVEKAEEALGITIEVEEVGTDADNLVKTRLASGDMADLVTYNAGSLLKALNPSEYFLDLSEYDIVDELDDTYRGAVTVDDAVYGIPTSSSSAMAILYSKDKYEEYDLEIPKTWDAFLENCETLKDAGETALIGSFADIWTTQFPFLGDYYNVVASDPEFTAEFEAGDAKYAETKSALASFQKCRDLVDYYNEDYLATTYNDASDKLAAGEGCQWFISSTAVGNIAQLYDKETADRIGIFGVPGDDAENAGITVSEPVSFYVNQEAEHTDAIMDFLEYYISQEGIDAYTEVQMVTGPMCVKDWTIADEYQLEVVKELQQYFEDGKVHVAQEFETAVKGSNCASICQEVGSGQTTAEEAAKKYDEDCYKQAVQLGLDWKE